MKGFRMKRVLFFSIGGIIIGLFALAVAHPSLEGYSGAPGSNGTCASSCHGSAGGTIQVSGFPTEYDPGSTYTIAISHDGGNSIVQFNASCRVGEGAENAGAISVGTNTAVYNNINETNGVHFSAQNLDNGTFSWTAPDQGTGEVRLYVAGLQGGFGGLNSAHVLIAGEQAAAHICGDSNCDGSVNVGDAVYLINFVFRGGPEPCNACP